MNKSRAFNPRQFAVLFGAGLRLSLTGSHGEQGDAVDDGSRHLLGAAYTLSLSTVVSAILYQNATPQTFLLVTMTLSMLFTGTSVIQELAGGLFHPRDLAVTGHLPVSGFTKFAARMALFGVLLCLLTANLNLVPAVLLFFATGNNILAPFACLFSALAASVFTAAVCLLLYFMLAKILSGIQLASAVLYLNIAVSLAILSLLINAGHLIQAGVLRDMGEGGWIPAYPPSWFAGLALYLAGDSGASPDAALAAVVALIAAAGLLLPGVLRSESLLQTLGGAVKQRGTRSAPGPIMALFQRLFVRREERAAFEFTAIQLTRDKGFRMKAYPILAFPVLIMSFSLYEDRDPLFFILMLHLANLYLPLIVTFLPYSDWAEGAWIFGACPVRAPEVFSRGVEKAFCLRIVLPLFVLNTAVLCWIWAPLPALIHSFYAMLAGQLVVSLALKGMVCYPFSRAFKGTISQQGVGGNLGMGVVILGLIAWMQFASRASTNALLVQIALLALLHAVRFKGGLFRKEGARA